MIDTEDIDGERVNLNEVLEKHTGVLLDFFRGSWWTHWLKHLTYLTENLDKLKELNVKLISIAIDPPDELIKMENKNNFKIQFVADRAGRLSKAYNVLSKAYDDFLDKNTTGHDRAQISNAIPSKFLINRERNIVWQYIEEKTDRPTIELIVKSIENHL